MNKAIRSYFSGKRNRYVDNEYNLDLTYITDRIIAMGYPSTRFESIYRNKINDVAKLLNAKHGKKYLIINLSDRRYDYSYFDGRVIDCGFPDHHSPPLCLMWCLYSIIDCWLAYDPENVIAVHCLAGKGRTGLSICCILLMQGYFNSMHLHSTKEYVDAAIHFFQEKRGDGVENPDQIRFIYQFIESRKSIGSDILVQSGNYAMKKVFIGSIILYNFPVGVDGDVELWYCSFIKKNNEWKMVWNSKWSEREAWKVTLFDNGIVCDMNCYCRGDVFTIFYNRKTVLFHFTINTQLLPSSSLEYPASLYLKHGCLSFSSQTEVPFTSSFAVQLIYSDDMSIALSTLSSELFTIAKKALFKERERRAYQVRASVSYSSMDSTPISISPSFDAGDVLFWRNGGEIRKQNKGSRNLLTSDYAADSPETPCECGNEDVSLNYERESYTIPAPKLRRKLTERERTLFVQEDPLFSSNDCWDVIVRIDNRSDALMQYPSFQHFTHERDIRKCSYEVFDGMFIRSAVILTDTSIRVMKNKKIQRIRERIPWAEVISVLAVPSEETHFFVAEVKSQTHIIRIRFNTFCELYQFVFTCRALCPALYTNPSPLPTSYITVLLTLYQPQMQISEAYLSTILAKGDSDVYKWMYDEFRVIYSDISLDGHKPMICDDFVVLADIVFPVDDYLALSPLHAASSPTESTVVAVKALLRKIQQTTSPLLYNRLIQIASIASPSPLPFFRAIVSNYGEKWTPILDQEPYYFLQQFEKSGTLNRNSLSTCVFRCSEYPVCSTNNLG